MAFNSRDLVLALVTRQGPNGEWEGMLGARSCGGTQGDCPNLRFDHLVADDNDLETLRDVLAQTLAAINSQLE